MKKIFTALIVLFPILSVYASPLQNVSLADLFLLLIILLVFLKMVANISKNDIYIAKIPPLAFLIYIVISFIIQVLLKSNVGIMSTLRYILYLIALLLAVKRYFDFTLAIKLLKLFTLVLSIYVIIQYLSFSLFKVTLPWHIPGIKIMDESFIMKESSAYYLRFYRPTGIFMEPTHLAQYLFLYLIYALFGQKQNSEIEVIPSIIISAALVASGSSLGMFILITIWSIYIFKNLIVKRIKRKNLLFSVLVILGAIGGILYLPNIPYVQKIFSRVVTNTGINGAAFGYRFNTYSVILDHNIPSLQRILGYGRSSINLYLATIPYLIYCNGIIGLILYLWAILDAFVKTKYFFRVVVIIMFSISFGSEIIINYGILFYFAFIYSGYKKTYDPQIECQQ